VNNVQQQPSDGFGGYGSDGATKVVDSMASETRQQLKMALWVIGIATVLTLYFFVLNAWLLYKAQPTPFTLRFDHTKAVDNARYEVFVQWLQSADEARKHVLVHPQLFINGELLPERSNAGRVTVGVNDTATVTIRIPEDATGGEHLGQIVFSRIAGSGPDRFTSNISLGVESSFVDNWFVLTRWLVVLGIAYLVFYAFCLYYFPLASGTLNVWVPNSGRSTPRRVAIRPSRLRLLMPWIRGQQSLHKLLRAAKAPASAVVPARIIFFFRGMPMMLPSRDARRKLTKSPAYGPADTTPDVPPIDDRRRLGGIEIMSESVAYSVGRETDSAFTTLRYKKP